MKQNRFLLSAFMFFTMGLAISYAQDKEHCILLELSSGEIQEVYLSAHPRLTQNNDKVNLVTDVGTTELGTTSIKKVYTQTKIIIQTPNESSKSKYILITNLPPQAYQYLTEPIVSPLIKYF